MNNIDPKIDPTWKEVLKNEFSAPSFGKLKEFLIEEKKKHTIYPPGPLIFNAFNQTPFDTVKVVILGQDPYHGPGQANGMCFSVPEGIKPPPSLVNIFKEQHTDLGIPIPKHGNLQKWANQGVLLINATLTVRAYNAGSHQKKGWEEFTDSVIRNVSEKLSDVVFILWGRYARAKVKLIDVNKHHILESAHPSPLSAYNGFIGCKHFSKTNELLAKRGMPAIDWSL